MLQKSTGVLHVAASTVDQCRKQMDDHLRRVYHEQRILEIHKEKQGQRGTQQRNSSVSIPPPLVHSARWSSQGASQRVNDLECLSDADPARISEYDDSSVDAFSLLRDVRDNSSYLPFSGGPTSRSTVNSEIDDASEDMDADAGRFSPRSWVSTATTVTIQDAQDAGHAEISSLRLSSRHQEHPFNNSSLRSLAVNRSGESDTRQLREQGPIAYRASVPSQEKLLPFEVLADDDSYLSGVDPFSLPTEYALIIDGRSITFALNSFPHVLLRLCKLCSCAILCRATPAQKARLVQLVQDEEKIVGLAIGDGANDVPMVQAARVVCTFRILCV